MATPCKVTLLDTSEIEINVKKNGKGKDLFDSVCKYLNLVEKDYFGIVYKDKDLQYDWIKLDKPLKKYLKKKSDFKFEFLVKFYPSDPTTLREEVTRYQLCLQIRQDILSGSIACPEDKLAILSSYWLQSEYGDGSEDTSDVKNYLASLRHRKDSDPIPEFEERVVSLYRSRRGMRAGDADAQFLATASGLPMYGVRFYVGKDNASNDAKIGISSDGITIRREGQRVAVHSWKHIKNIEYSKQKFKINLLRAPSDGDPRLKKSFLFASEEQVRKMWKDAVGLHVFFRIDKDKKKPERTGSSKKPKKRKSILRRLSSRKDKPKTEADVQEESSKIRRAEPTVVRVSSLRRSESLRTRSSSEFSKTPPQQGAIGGAVERTIHLSKSKDQKQDSDTSSSEGEVIMQKDPPVYAEIKPNLPPREVTVELQKKSKDEVRAEGKKEDDLLEAVIGKMDATSPPRRGSSSLLLTETIVEEEEEDRTRPPGRTDSTKIHQPVAYAPLKDENPPVMGTFGKMQVVRDVVETDVDAAPSQDELKPVRDESRQLLTEEARDTSLVRKHVVTETTDEKREIAEVWEEVQLGPPSPRKRNVHFEDFTPNTDFDFELESPTERAESPETIEESKEEDAAASSSSSEGEVQFKRDGSPQMQNLPEDEELKIRDAPMPLLTFDDLANKEKIERQLEFDDITTTIKEYIPTIRKESSDETEEDEEDENSREEENLQAHEGDVWSKEGTGFLEDGQEDIEQNQNLEWKEVSRDYASERLRESSFLYFHEESGERTEEDAEDSAHPQENAALGKKEEDLQAHEGDVWSREGTGFLEDGQEDIEQNQNLEWKEVSRDYASERLRESSFLDFHEESRERTEDSAHPQENAALGKEEEDIYQSNGIESNFKEEEEREKDFQLPELKFSDSEPLVNEEIEITSLLTGNESNRRSVDVAAASIVSTTGATTAEEFALAIKDLDDDIQDEGDNKGSEESNVNEDYALDEEQIRPKVAPLISYTSTNDSVSRSTSLSDITDNTDELLQPNILEKTWSQGALLGEEDEMFQILFRTPPRKRRRLRNRSEINPKEVPSRVNEARILRTTFDEVELSPRRSPRKGDIGRRPFIPSWPFDPTALIDSRDLDDLDKEAIKAAMDAQKELIEDWKGSTEFSETVQFPEDIAAETRDDESVATSKLEEYIAVRSRSPSASPRMVGEAFIPGVPDFVHSVIPYQLDSAEQKVERKKEIPIQPTEKDLEALKYPQNIIKFSATPEESQQYRYSPPAVVMQTSEKSVPAHPETPSAAVSRAGAQSTSSGRSTPQSNNETSSNSTTSKSSGSSFPRFVHSVFPLRRSSSSDRRGRSKTRRKREKKITKEKNKRKTRSGSRNKEKAKKQTVPAIEVTSPHEKDTNMFSGLPSPPHYPTAAMQGENGIPLSMYFPSAARLSGKQTEEKQFEKNLQTSQYDQESIDKIVLSESDDAHTDEETPLTARLADDYEEPVKLSA